MEYLIPPWKHQLEAIARAEHLDNFALFFEQGCGKTPTAINILRSRYEKAGRLQRTLVLCPLIVIENWKREFLAHSKVAEDKIILLQGSEKVRLKLFHDAHYKADGYVVVMNYEGLLMPTLFMWLETWKPELLVLDESHKCKDGQSKRTKQTIKLADIAAHKYILTGTPVLKNPMDLFSQYRILDGGKTFTKNFFQFRAMYFYDANSHMPKALHFPDWRVRPGALDEMNKLIYRQAMRVTKKEALDLPPLVRQQIYVGMTPEQSRMYLQMKEEFITYLNDKACVASLAIVRALRLMEIVSGYAKFEDGEALKYKDTPRMEALKALLEDLAPDHKILVWAVWKENYVQIRRVCEDLKIGYVEVHGAIAAKQKQENIDRLNHDPSVRVFIGHPGSGGIGCNLTASDIQIWYSRNFSLEYDLQAEARNHRGGSKEAGHEKITRIDLVTKGTIDELVLKKLADKQGLGEELLKSLKTQL